MSFENLKIISEQFTGIRIMFHDQLETSLIVEIQGLRSDGTNFEILITDAVRSHRELIDLIDKTISQRTE